MNEGKDPVIPLDAGEPEAPVDRETLPVGSPGDIVPFVRGYGVDIVAEPEAVVISPLVKLPPAEGTVLSVVGKVALPLEKVNGKGAVPVRPVEVGGLESVEGVVLSFVAGDVEGRTGLVDWRDSVPPAVSPLLGDDTTELELPSGNGGWLEPVGKGVWMVPVTPLEKIGETVAGTE